MFRHWVTSMTIGVAVFLWAASVGAPGWAQHGGGGHGGGGHGGGGHAGGGHARGGHGSYGHSGGGHSGGASHYGGGHSGGASHYGGLGHHGYGVHGYGDYGHDYSYSHYDSPAYFSLSYEPRYGSYGYAYDDGLPRYDVAYGSDSSLPYVSATLAQGCAPRGSCGGAGPVGPPPPSSGRSSRSVAGGKTAQLGPGYQRGAEEAFRAGRYDQALRLANHALVETPRDGKLHLFASQILLATEDYQGAATAIHQGASLLKPKDWGYVVENFRKYYRGRDYVKQMDRLTKFIKANPEAAHARFLRGYHYGYLGYKEAAHRELAKAVELEGRDKLAARLLKMFAVQMPPDPDGPEAGDIPIGPGDDAGTPEDAGDEPHHDEHNDHQH